MGGSTQLGRRPSSQVRQGLPKSPSGSSVGLSRPPSATLSNAGARVLNKAPVSPSIGASHVQPSKPSMQRRATINGIADAAAQLAHSAKALAKLHRLEVYEVKLILGAFEYGYGRESGVGLSRAAFHNILCSIFDCKVIESEILDVAYAAADCLGKTPNVNQFLEWYVQNIFTIVSKLHAAPDQYSGDKLVDELAKQYKCSVAVIDRAKMQFDKFDADKSGAIDYHEYISMMHVLLQVRNPSDLSDTRLKKFWNEIDRNSDGVITFPEFTIWYLKYFAEGSSKGPVEALYSSYDPSQQRWNSIVKDQDSQRKNMALVNDQEVQRKLLVLSRRASV